MLANGERFTLISNRLFEFEHIAVKSRENSDEENSGGVERQPFLSQSANTKSEGIYWSNAQSNSNKINIVF